MSATETQAVRRDSPAAAAAVYAGLQTACWTDDGGIRAVLPLPPGVLGHHGGGWVTYGVRKNGSRYYASQYRIEYAAHRGNAISVYSQTLLDEPWRAARLDVEWRFAGHQSDPDGVTTRISAYRDAAQVVGIVEDDVNVRQTDPQFVRVPRRYQCVVITFRKDDAA